MKMIDIQSILDVIRNYYSIVLIWLGGLSAFTVLVILLSINYLEKIDIVFGHLYNLIAIIYRGFRKKAIAKRIESQINSRTEAIETEIHDLMPNPMRIKWIDSDDEFAKLKNGEIVIFLRNRLDDVKNRIVATQMYIENGFLSESRPYIHPGIQKATDLIVAWKLISASQESDESQYFLQNVFNPCLSNEPDISVHTDILRNFDTKGVFTRIFLREMRGLGQKAKSSLPSQEHWKESERFTKFLDTIEKAEKGTHYPLNFIGRYFKASVQLVASKENVAMSGLRIHKRWLKKKTQMGVETIYIRGIGSQNVKLALNLAQWGQKESLVEIVRNQLFEISSTTGVAIEATVITCNSRQARTDLILDPEEEVSAALVRHIPEIACGDVEILDVAREVGLQSKVVIQSGKLEIDVSRQYLNRLNRNIKDVVTDLQESVWLVPWMEDLELFIIQILGITQDDIVGVTIDRHARHVEIEVGNEKCAARAIGSKGSNVRIARELTGYHITLLDQKTKTRRKPVLSPEDSLKKSLSAEIQEIKSGQIEIVDLIREPGIQSKILVRNTAGSQSPIPICLGKNNLHLEAIKEEFDEAIWFVAWDNDPKAQLTKCLGIRYGKLESIDIDPQTRIAHIVVRDREACAMAIGEHGINAMQTAHLTKLNRLNITVCNSQDVINEAGG
jgi:transcription antitermination factor NusA-like protein